MLTACSLSPHPVTVNERYREATQALCALNIDNSNRSIHLDYYDALIRSVKYNLDYRVKIANIAMQAGQLDVAVFAMFPNLNVSGTIYTRNNEYQVSGITAEGVSTGLSSSTPRTLRTARVAMSWNILDFGMGYVKAKQQSDRVLIAHEESRRQLQQLAQDVLVAYWVAYSAQQLIHETEAFQRLLRNAKRTLNIAIRDKLVPKENLLNYQSALLEGDRKLIQLHHKYERAMLDLKHLLFLPVDEKIILAPPPAELFHPQNLNALALYKMDIITLINHPELRSQHYQERIAKFGLSTVLLQALPGITFNYGANYDSNKFLLNNRWLDKSIDLAWNLLNLASLPATYKTAKTQFKYEKLKEMAMTMAALVETRYAYKHYITLHQEYQLAHAQTNNAKALYKLSHARQVASVASEQQAMLAKLKFILTKMDEDLLLSDLSVALGQLYLSIGVDIIPECITYQPHDEAKIILRNQLQHDFVSFVDKKYAAIHYAAYQLPIHHCCQSYHKRYHLCLRPSKHCQRWQSREQYTIQVTASTDFQRIKSFKNNFKSKQLKMAKINYKGKNYYVLTYGRFGSRKSAVFASHVPPKALRKLPLWVRKTDNLTWIS
jgi:hypothetical protein